ncbi:hypothetical protein CFIMG_006370RA [Ceratocystis fimbriata CBS 114723]|uniref:Uncharacterized protein n=1 Tax=Ceratocystis fimbriata CBS 114723 TaxID=1035309 RepID=A0A2C5WVD4_9PEZI|nr:hypothetical protein CFIMG_006370RA [Ceratocystis fimbriata CBS 114723]
MTAKPVPGLQERLDLLADSSYMLATSSPETSAYFMRQRNQLLSDYGITIPEVEKHRICGACSSVLALEAEADVRIETGVRHVKAQRRAEAIERKRALARDKTMGGNKTVRSEAGDKECRKTTSNTRQKRPQVARVGVSKITKCHRCSSFTKSQIALPPVSLRFKPAKWRKKSKGKSKASNDNTAGGIAPTKTLLAGETHAVTGTIPSAGNKNAVSSTAPGKKRKKTKNGGLQALLAQQKKPVGGLSLADFMKR